MSGNATYDFAVTYFIDGLTTFDHILSKAEEFAKEKGIDVDTFFSARLIEDQLPLSFQVQITTYVAKVNLGRLIGQDAGPFEKEEKTFAELQTRVKDTLEYLKAADVSKAAGTEDSLVEMYVFAIH